MTADERFKAIRLQVEHPDPVPFPAKFAPSLLANDMLYLSGEGPRWGSDIKYQGTVWETISLEEARVAAEITTLNLLWHAQQALGRLENVEQVLEVLGFVRSTSDFGQQPKVLDASSSILLQVFGEDRGRHARCAIGVTSLPVQICVEIRMVMLVTGK